MLSAGERRSFTANTIFRDPRGARRTRRARCASTPPTPSALGLADGRRPPDDTRGSVEVVVERLPDTMQPGHVSLPNGLGLDYPAEDGVAVVTGGPPNELTATDDRDWLAGTPWHKHVPARVEAV